jgi:histidyl-tRNA synthetase
VKLRKSGLNVLVYMEEDKIKKKFKYSDRADVPYVMVVGEDEVKSGKYALKDMCKGKQDLYTLGEIADLILSEK